MEYRREIDGLRAIAVISVILYHAGLQAFSGGFVGVDVFFVISGFLITSIILSEKDAGNFTLSNFYERRVRRILPALFLMTFICIPYGWFFMAPSDLKEFSESVLSLSVFASNILFWKTSGYFDTSAELKPLIHTWSLAVEEQFYLLFPIFLTVFWGLGKRVTISMLIVFFCISLAMAEWGSLHKPTATFFLLPTRAFEILIGTFVAFYLHTKVSVKSPNYGVSQSGRQAGSALGFLLVVYAVVEFDKQTPLPGLFTLVPTVGAALIIIFANHQTLVGQLLGSKVFVGIGLISYSTYLWHQPILAFIRIRIGNEINNIFIFPILLITVAFATLSWKFVEVPFRNKNLTSQKLLFLSGILCSISLILFGFFGSYTKGFIFRYEKDDRYLAQIDFHESGKYVAKRFTDLMMKDFDNKNGRRKILIVGDSFAQDLVNALYEVGFEKTNQFSTRYIIHGCGNLFINRGEFVDKIDKNCFKTVSGFGYE